MTQQPSGRSSRSWNPGCRYGTRLILPVLPRRSTWLAPRRVILVALEVERRGFPFCSSIKCMAAGSPGPHRLGHLRRVPVAERGSFLQARGRPLRLPAALQHHPHGGDSPAAPRLASPFDFFALYPHPACTSPAVSRRCEIGIGRCSGEQVLNKATMSTEANILRFSPTTARFGYLPISTPSATASGLRQLPPTGAARAGTPLCTMPGRRGMAAATSWKVAERGNKCRVGRGEAEQRLLLCPLGRHEGRQQPGAGG